MDWFRGRPQAHQGGDRQWTVEEQRLLQAFAGDDSFETWMLVDSVLWVPLAAGAAKKDMSAFPERVHRGPRGTYWTLLDGNLARCSSAKERVL